MRTIGLLGGMSWVSTAAYYRMLNERVRDTRGDLHSARCVLYSVDFAEVEALMAADRWAEAGALLGAAAKRVRAAGAELLLLCTNTLHKVADDIQAAVDIPLLHVADVAADAVNAAGLGKVGLLGTGYVMGQDFYVNRLARHGFETIVPSEPDRAEVHRIIFEELVRDTFSDESRKTFRAVIDRLAESGAQGVILGCTELELLLDESDSSLPLFPTTKLHVEAALAG
jgi:aspartate racemase